MKTLLSFLCLLCLTRPAPAADDQAAIIDGPGFAFTIIAPKGWKLTATPTSPAAFHPADTTFDKAPVVMYVRTVEKKALRVANAAELNQLDLKGIKESKPEAKSEKVGTIDANERKGLPLYSFTGGGFSELVAYAEDEKTITVFVVSADTDELLKKNRPAFEELLKSYLVIASADKPAKETNDKEPKNKTSVEAPKRK